jgi:hypothetical protein
LSDGRQHDRIGIGQMLCLCTTYPPGGVYASFRIYLFLRGIWSIFLGFVGVSTTAVDNFWEKLLIAGNTVGRMMISAICSFIEQPFKALTLAQEPTI